MRTLFLIIFILASGMSSYGQIDKSEFYGSWTVKRVLEKPSDPDFEPLIDGFSKANFKFQENGDFSLITESESPMFQMVTEMTNNTKWKFDSKEQLIRIGGEEDGYSIMGIYPKRNNETFEFFIDEGGMTFEMEKSK